MNSDLFLCLICSVIFIVLMVKDSPKKITVWTVYRDVLVGLALILAALYFGASYTVSIGANKINNGVLENGS